MARRSVHNRTLAANDQILNTLILREKRTLCEQTKQLQPSYPSKHIASLPGVLRAVAPFGPAGHHQRDWPTSARPFHDRGKRHLFHA